MSSLSWEKVMAMSLGDLKALMVELDRKHQEISDKRFTVTCALRDKVDSYINKLKLPVNPLEAATGYLRLLEGEGEDALIIDTHRDGTADFALAPPGDQEGLGYDMVQEVVGETLQNFKHILLPLGFSLRWNDNNDGQMFFHLRKCTPSTNGDDDALIE